MTGARRVGERAWLLEARDGAQARGLAAAVRSAAPAGLIGVRAGARTVLASFASRGEAVAARDLLEVLVPEPSRTRPGAPVLLEVVYDGPDLEAVAAGLGLSEQALVAEHAEAEWHADFLGFAPGFAYLSGWRHQVARRAEPRTRVPVGAVGLAGGYTAAYPSASPGGWQLIGRTAALLWDVEREPPALVAPGDRVRFVPVRELAVVPDVGADAAVAEGADAPGADAPDTLGAAAPDALVVLDPGPSTLVQDRGRAGREHLGLPPSGAADLAAAGRANRAVGNPRDAAVLETLGGLVVRSRGDLVIAVTGGTAHLADGTVPDPGRPFALPRGAELGVVAEPGLRAYLAVRGGLVPPAVLGSRSTDVLSGTGPPPLHAGAVVPIGEPAGVVGGAEPEPAREGVVVLSVVLGPRDDWFAEPRAIEREWTVTADSNRAGLRLTGGRLTRVPERMGTELESEPMVPGSIQVPASGEPVVLLRDHPVTGGYPVVGVVRSADLDAAGQLAPGARVRLVVLPD